MTGQVLAAVTPYTVPGALMDALQVVILVLVAGAATAVVLIRVPVRQTIALSAYGLLRRDARPAGRRAPHSP